MPELICICGPTAAGKTGLAVDMALSLGGEVVSCDSMQVYCGMDIGTAKATPEEMRGVRHHMIDVADPRTEDFSVARYVEMAVPIVDDIIARGKPPIVVGGTNLYMDSLIKGSVFSDFDRGGIREELNIIANNPGGAQELFDRLRECDPQSAEKLHPNDIKRIVRALEVYYLTGKPISLHNEEDLARPARYKAKRIVLSYRDRDILYDRINRRVDMMLERGLLKEVESLINSGLSRSSTAMQAIGYKEFSAYLEGEVSFEEAVETVKRESRRYAKRQLTWLRRYADAEWRFLDE
ncbi:MAG: tRNA (adenosine(37)-N6)-dimethylallyltransferase MiaA [Oscillospiraceae bacterium]